jgi:hypothetical protein
MHFVGITRLVNGQPLHGQIHLPNQIPDPHHPLGAGTINRKDMLWMNGFTLMIHCAKE